MYKNKSWLKGCKNRDPALNLFKYRCHIKTDKNRYRIQNKWHKSEQCKTKKNEAVGRRDMEEHVLS